jgi:AraC family transcriptional regulator, transcriptional activator of the genes for pyochelin and ferripyochelin receptors
MAITLSEENRWDLWYENNPMTQYPEPGDDSDIIYPCPERLGLGHRRIIELRGIELLVINETYHDDLIIRSSPGEKDRCIEFGFNLSGLFANRPSGHNFLQWGLCNLDTYEASGKARLLKVDIHLESLDVLRSFMPSNLDSFPPALRKFIEEGGVKPYDDLGIITPAMGLALEQLMNCPFQGLTKHIYLEAKSLELVALKLDQLAQDIAGMQLFKPLKPEDIERIYQARKILRQNLEYPPSLMSLARQVGLNDYTLKKGFRQMFGTTAFGYLHQCRMEQAKMLLLEQKFSVSRVCQAVGYASRSAFVTAFRKQFGVNPSAYASRNSV